ncbi:MAG: tetratricopeptide repeat protein [Planctomycetota bacterium]|nr:tetratricopeptide repeat protein [Planctomycetota bacterium]
MRFPVAAALCAVIFFASSSLFAQPAAELYKQAEQHRRAGDFGEAVKAYRQFLRGAKRDSNYKEAQLNLASSLLEIGEAIQAGRVLGDFVQQWPGDKRESEVRLQVAQLHEANGDFLKAVASYKELLERFKELPNGHELRMHLCRIYEDVLSNPTRAVAEYEALLKRDPKGPKAPEILMEIGRTHEKSTGDLLAARDAYVRITENFAANELAEEALYRLAIIADEGGSRQFAVAALHYRDFLTKYPKSNRQQAIAERLAHLYLNHLKQYQNAADAYTAVLTFNDTPQVRLARLRALEKTQDPARILPAYREFIEKNPNTREARTAGRNLSQLLWDLDKQDEAIAELKKVATAESASIDDRLELARMQNEAGQYDQALTTFAEIAASQPSGDLFVRMSTGPLALVAKIREKQREEIPEAEELPMTPEITAAYAKAETVLKEALEKYPDHQDITVTVAWQLATGVYEPQKKFAEAAAALAPIFQNHPSYQHHASREHGGLLLLKYYREADQLDQASKLLYSALARHPSHPRLRETLAELVNVYVRAALPLPVAAEEASTTRKPRPAPLPAPSEQQVKKYLKKAIDIAQSILRADDSDTAAALATAYVIEAYMVSGEELEGLTWLARLPRYQADQNFRGLHGIFLDIRKKIAEPALYALTHDDLDLKTWRFKQDPNNAGEAEDWVSKADHTQWQEATAGKDWGDFDGYGWFATTIAHTGSPESYRLRFESIGGEAWVYANGTLVGNLKEGANEVSFPLTGEDEIKQLSLVIRIQDKGGEGGLTGKVMLSRPKPLADADLLKSALSNHALGRADEAVRQYDAYLKYIEKDGIPAGLGDPRPLVASMKNDILLLRGELEAVEQSITESSSPFLLLRLADSFGAKKDDDKAFQYLQRAREASQRSPHTIRRLAQAYERRNMFEEAIAEYTSLLTALSEADVESLKRHIVYLAAHRLNNVKKARSLAQKFNKKTPSSYWERTLADLYKDRDPRDYAMATEHYRNYLGYAGKEDVDIWHGGASIWDVLNREQKYEEAIKWAEEWRKQYPAHQRSLEMIYLIGQTHRSRNRIADAAGVYNELIEKYSDSNAALLCAQSAIDSFTSDLRDGIVNKWFEKNPGDERAADLYLRLGQRYEPEAGGLERAIESYKVVWNNFRAKSPENFRAADRLSHLLFVTGKLEEGAKVSREILALAENQTQGEAIRAWYRLLDHYGPRVAFKAEVDTTFSAGTTPGRIIDGDPDGRGGNPSYAWLSEISPREHWVDAALYEPAQVNHAHIFWGNSNELPKQYKLQYWDGNAYKPVHGYDNWRAAEGPAEELKFKKPVTTTKLRIVQASSGGSTAKANQMTVAEVRVFALQPDEAVARYKSFVRDMIRQFTGRREAFHAREHLVNFHLLRNEYIESNIQMQRLLFGSPKGDAWHWDQLVALARTRTAQGRHGEAASIYRTLLKLNPTYGDKAKVASVETELGEALKASGSGSLVIDPNAPEAGLLWGNAFALAGEEELAWQRYLENIETFEEHQHKLSIEFLTVIVNRHLSQKQIKQGVEICMSFVNQRGGDATVPDADKAKMLLLLGDCYYRDQRFEIAREHYTTAANQYPNSAEGIEARFKIVSVFIAQKLFDRGADLLKDLLDSKDTQTVIRAHIMMGILYTGADEKKAAVDEFRKVLMMSPGAETADEIIYRLGSVYHEQGRYKESIDTLKLIGAWSGETRRVVDIGGEMRIRISDQDLTVTRGSADVPVIVQVIGPDGVRKDRERVLLNKSEAGAGLYVGGIRTKLGEPIPDDRTLQVTGSDVISYSYDPDFAKDFIIDQPEKEFTLKVASNAEFAASSTEIKDEDDAELTVEELNPNKPDRKEFRKESELKPGNNIYLKVVDFDLDKTSQVDKAMVTLTTTSGDKVDFELEETGVHTGKFFGHVKTGIRPPDAIASDYSEGHTPVFAIDGNNDPQKTWMGLMDGQSPKWLQIDLKELYPVDKVVWHRGEGARDREPIRYQIQVSDDSQIWKTAATFPEDWNYHDRLMYGPLQVRTMPNYIGDPKDLRQIMDMCELAPRQYGEGRVEWINDEAGNPWGPDEYYIAVYWGNFYCPETGTYEFAVDSDDAAFLLIDGELVAEFPGNHAQAKNWDHKGKIFLEKGVHKITYYFQEWEIIQVIRAAWKLPSHTEFEVIPKEFFDPVKYPGLKKLEKLAERKFKVAEAKDGYGASITFDPRKVRYVRMMIEEFHSDAPAIASFEVWAQSDQIVPTKGVDIHTIATNQVLELTPGDEVTAAYTDEVNVEPGSPLILRSMLSVTYFNGEIEGLTKVVVEDSDARSQENFLLTKRINAGDPFVVRITDYDEDTSDGIDTLSFTIRTLAQSKSYKFDARETGPFTGIFEAVIQTSIEDTPGAVLLSAGDAMELAYIDRENTEPGHAVERMWKVLDNQPTKGVVRAIPWGEEIKGPEKWEDKLRLISLEDGLTIEVLDPDRCLHEGSVIRVNLTGTYGNDTALVECRVAGAAAGGPLGGAGDKEKLLEALGQGLFRGHIKTLLGDDKSPDFMVQAAGMFDEEAARSVKSKKDKDDVSQIPVLNVSGQDVINIVYVDEQSPDSPLAMEEAAHARILSNGAVGFFDDTYETEIEFAHIGEKIYLMVTDFDADESNENDFITVEISTTSGERLITKLKETLSHSGIFSAGITLNHAIKPNPGNIGLEADYGDEITVRYVDVRNTEQPKPVERVTTASVVAGTDGVISGFSKRYSDEAEAIETEFKIGECLYFLGKEHMKLKKEDMAKRELKEGRDVLGELLTYYPDSSLLDQAAFMLGNMDLEEKRYDEAIISYRRLIRDYQDSPVAPDAQYSMGQAYEFKGEFDKACEEYVKLAYKFPDSHLLPEAMVRIGVYYFEKKIYETSISVFDRFIEKYPDNDNVEKVYFKMGLAYILNEDFIQGGAHFKAFIDKFPSGELTPAALYWSGDSYLKANNALFAYQMFKRCIWDYPESKWAKFARGRLTSPVFDRISEME